MMNALDQRYGTQDKPHVGPWNDTIALLVNHRTVRRYRSDPLEEGTLETLITAAQSAATSSNMQSWSVVAVTDPDRKQRLAHAAQNQEFMHECPLLLCFVADLSRARRVGEIHSLELNSLELMEAFLVAATDAALAAQNTVIAAESLGLSTCYIGALRNNPEVVHDELKLPRGTLALFGLCIGRADLSMPTPVKPRMSQRLVLHREQYDTSEEKPLLTAYDAALHAFGGGFKRSVKTWAERVHGRWSNPIYLDGRQHLRAMLAKFGFSLE